MIAKANDKIRLWPIKSAKPIEIYAGEQFTVLATIPCPEQFVEDHQDPESIDGAELPEYYVIWCPTGTPILVCSQHFDIV